MAFFGFKNYKARQFNYNPIFYDPAKEAREQRREEMTGVRSDSRGKEYVPGEIIRSRMGARMQDMEDNHRSMRNKSIRSAVIIVALLVVGAWILLTV